MERNEATNTRARTVRRYIIPGCLNVSNFCWATVTSLGGAGFILAGLSSFVQRNLLPFTFDFRSIVFFPQGLVMVFYGTVGLFFGLYTWFTIYWRIGSGFNEIDPYRDRVRIFVGVSRVKIGALTSVIRLRTSKRFAWIYKTG